jgi:hypothetical protein
LDGPPLHSAKEKWNRDLSQLELVHKGLFESFALLPKLDEVGSEMNKVFFAILRNDMKIKPSALKYSSEETRTFQNRPFNQKSPKLTSKVEIWNIKVRMTQVAPSRTDASAERPWPNMVMTKGDVALRMKDFNGALNQFTHALALASPDNSEQMVALLCRRAVALLYLKVEKIFFFPGFFLHWFNCLCGFRSTKSA